MTDISKEAMEVLARGHDRFARPHYDLLRMNPSKHERTAESLRALSAEVTRLTAELATARNVERDRCERIVMAARMGNIDQDMRTLLHFIGKGDQMLRNPETGKYEHDSQRADREAVEAAMKGQPHDQ